MRCAWLVMLAGCGRLEFGAVPSSDAALEADARPDARPCVAAGHDEDRDGTDDACDVCPHLPDPAQADRDGDQVGDACDPRPDTPTERIVFFDPFRVQRAEWNHINGTPTFDGESLTIDARSQVLVSILDTSPTDDVFAIGGRLGAGALTGNRQQTISLYATNPQTLYCELYFDTGQPKFSITYTLDGAAFNFVDESPAQAPLENTDFSLTFAYSPTTATCDTAYPVTKPRLSGPTPSAFGAPTDIAFSVRGMVARYDWFIQIHTE